MEGRSSQGGAKKVGARSHLAYKTVWETRATMISLVLHGDGGNTMFGVIYSSKGAGEDKGTEKGE